MAQSFTEMQMPQLKLEYYLSIYTLNDGMILALSPSIFRALATKSKIPGKELVDGFLPGLIDQPRKDNAHAKIAISFLVSHS